MQGQSFGFHKVEGVVVPLSPATPEQIKRNIRQWHKDQKAKATKKALKAAVVARVTEGHATIGQVLVAKVISVAKQAL